MNHAKQATAEKCKKKTTHLVKVEHSCVIVYDIRQKHLATGQHVDHMLAVVYR